MTALFLITAIVLLIKYGWRIVKFIFTKTWSVLGLILLVSIFTSDSFLDSAFKDDPWLKENGYAMGSDGVKEAFRDGTKTFWDNRVEILDATKEVLIEYRDSLINSRY